MLRNRRLHRSINLNRIFINCIRSLHIWLKFRGSSTPSPTSRLRPQFKHDLFLFLPYIAQPYSLLQSRSPSHDLKGSLGSLTINSKFLGLDHTSILVWLRRWLRSAWFIILTGVKRVSVWRLKLFHEIFLLILKADRRWLLVLHRLLLKVN